MTTLSASNFSEIIAPHVRYHSESHSHTQIDHFMIGGGGEGHPWGMYRQALRELNGRESLMVGLKHSLAVLHLDLREQQLKLEGFGDVGLDKSALIARERVELEIEYIEVKIKADEHRESRALFEGNRILDQAVKHMATLREANGWAEDYELTAADLHRLDEDFWIHSMRQQCAIHHFLGKPPPVDVIKMLPRLPARMADPIFDALASPARNYGDFKFFATKLELNEPRRIGGVAR